MSSKIEVPRKLAERLESAFSSAYDAAQEDSYQDPDAEPSLSELRAILAATVVERQYSVLPPITLMPGETLVRSGDTYKVLPADRVAKTFFYVGEVDGYGCLYSEVQHGDAMALYTAPPELAELQAPTNSALINDLTEVIAQQAAEIERLKAGQGEPVDALLLSDCVEHLHRSYGGGYFGTEVVQLYASQPAPVSVVVTEEQLQSLADEAFRKWEKTGNPVGGVNGYMAAKAGFREGAAWATCAALSFDKIKELNP